MKSRSSLVAFAATLILHLGLAAAIVFGLPDSQDRKQQAPVKIALLQPAAAPQPAPPPAVSAPQQSEKPSPKRDSRPSAKSETKHPPALTAQSARADALTEAKPAPSTNASTSSASPPSQPAAPAIAAPPQASAPVRTSATDATYASTNRKPPYPRISQSNEEEGTVILRVLVKADGTAGTVEIKQSSGYPRLNEAARSTVQTWRFTPATVDGKPVAEWYQVAIPFTLQSN